MHFLPNFLKWICIPLLLSCLSQAGIHDTPRTSLQRSRDVKHIRQERQTLLRAFVLGDFIPFAAGSYVNNAEGSQRTEGVNRKLAKKLVDNEDIQSQIKQSRYVKGNQKNEKEQENVIISNVNQLSNSKEFLKNNSKNGSSFVDDNKHWNDHGNSKGLNKHLQDFKNENEQQSNHNFGGENKKKMNEFSRENKDEIKPLIFEEIKPRKNEGRFGDLGHVAFKSDMKNKTQNNSQKRKLGFLKNNSSGSDIFSEKRENNETISSRKGDNGLIDAPPDKIGRIKSVSFRSSSNHIEKSKSGARSTSRGITLSKASTKVLEHLKNSGESAKSFMPNDKDNSFVDNNENWNNDVNYKEFNVHLGDMENENKNKMSSFDENKKQINKFSRENNEFSGENKDEVTPLIKGIKNEDELGDLGYDIITQNIKNKAQTNSEKQKVGFLRNTTNTRVSAKNNSNFERISQLNKGGNGLVVAHITKTPGAKMVLFSNFLSHTEKKVEGHNSTLKDMAVKSKSNKTKLNTKRHYSSSMLSVQNPYRRAMMPTNSSKMSKDTSGSNPLPNNTQPQSTVNAKPKSRSGEASSKTMYSKRKTFFETLGLSLANNRKATTTERKAYSNITSNVIHLKKMTPTLGKKSVPSKHRGYNFTIYSRLRFGKVHSEGKKEVSEKKAKFYKNGKEITVERNGFKNKITIEQNLPETSGYDLYILKVPPSRNITAKTTKRKLVVSKKLQDNGFGSLHTANQSYIEMLKKKIENQLSLFRKILNIPVKTIFDLFVPYVQDKSIVENLRLKDLTENLTRSTFSSTAVKNISNITISARVNRSRVFVKEDFRKLSDSATENSKPLTNKTRNLKHSSNTPKKDTFNHSKVQESKILNVSNSLITKIQTKGTSEVISTKKSFLATSILNFFNHTYNNTRLNRKAEKNRLKLSVESTNKTIGVKTKLNKKSEKLFLRNSTRENIKVFLNPSLLEQDTQAQTFKKSFTPEGSDDVSQAGKSDESKAEVNRTYSSPELVYNEHNTTSNENNPYFISLTAHKTKRKATGTEFVFNQNASKSDNDMNISDTSSGEMSLRSNIGEIQSSNLLYPSYQNTGFNQNNEEQFTNRMQNEAPGLTAAGNTYWGSSNTNLFQKTETSGEINNYRQFSSTRLPVNNAQFTFRIHQTAQTPVVGQRQEMNSYQQLAGDLKTSYKGIFGNTGIDLERSCMNYGKQDNCPTGWAGYKQFCFMAMPGANRWSDVAGLCSRSGAKMAMPKSQDVLAFLVNMLTSMKQYSIPYFLGLRKKDEEWEWIDDTPLSRALPDAREDNLESCAVLLEGSLRKMSCDLNNGYICELKTGVRVSRILAFGDSLTKGYFNGGKNYHPYGEKLEELLNRDDHGCFVVEISGKNGEKTGNMVHRLTNYLNTIQRTFNWVVLLAGTNDLLVTFDSAEAIADQIEIMHEVVHARGAKSIAVTIPEIFCEQTTCPNMRERRKRVNKRIRLYASSKENKVFLSDLALSLSRNRLLPSDRNAFWEPAGVHMKPRGYDKMAEIIFKDLMESAEASTLDR